MGLCYLYSRTISLCTFAVVSASKPSVTLSQGFSAYQSSGLPLFQTDFCHLERVGSGTALNQKLDEDESVVECGRDDHGDLCF